MAKSLKSTISIQELQLQKDISEKIRQYGYLFLDTDDGEIWVTNAAPAAVIPLLDVYTYPRLSKLMQQRKIQEELTVLSILSGDETPCIAILRAHTAQYAEVLSFWIHPRYRREGLGRLLLNQIDLLCLKSRVKKITLTYRTYWKYAPIWSKMLAERGWQETQILMYYVILSDWEKILTAPWLAKVHIPTTISIEKANPEKLQHLVAQWQKNGQLQQMPAVLHPLQMIQQLDEQASIIAYQNGEPIGWCLLHQINPTTWQCLTLYVLPEKRAYVGLGMIAELLRRHERRGNLHFMVEPNNQLMLGFINRHLLPNGGMEKHQQIEVVKNSGIF